MIVNLMGLSTTNYCNLFIVRNIFIIYVTHSHISLFNKPCDENLIKVLTLRKFPNVELSDVPLVTRTPSLYLPTPSHYLFTLPRTPSLYLPTPSHYLFTLPRTPSLYLPTPSHYLFTLPRTPSLYLPTPSHYLFTLPRTPSLYLPTTLPLSPQHVLTILCAAW